MPQLFGYLCSDDTLTQAVMELVGDQLDAAAPEDRGGLGLGWIQDGRSLLRKHPRRHASSGDLSTLLTDIPARTLIGHIRHISQGAAATQDLQPFRFRDWVFAQYGPDEELEGLADAFHAELPDHIRRNVAGKTIAELIFHLYLSRLNALGAFTGGAVVSPRACAAALVETMQDVEQRALSEGLELTSPFLTIAATDRMLFAARIGEPFHYRYIEGIEEHREKPLFAGHNPRPIAHPRFRALLVSNRVDAPDDSEWRELEDRHVLWVEPGWNVQVAAFDEVAARAVSDE